MANVRFRSATTVVPTELSSFWTWIQSVGSTRPSQKIRRTSEIRCDEHTSLCADILPQSHNFILTEPQAFHHKQTRSLESASGPSCPPSIPPLSPLPASLLEKHRRTDHDSMFEIMLKPAQHRSSPASSPIFHYAPTSNSLPTSPLSRRQSKSRASFAKVTPPTRAQYVDAGTQWSPRLNSKMESTRTQSPGVKIEKRSQEPEPTATLAAVPTLPLAPERPLLQPESPGLKRRQSQDPPAPTSNVSQTIQPKRSRSDETVKILPAKYEFCPVEDMVVLISNMIQELIQTNDSLPLRSGVLTRFHSR